MAYNKAVTETSYSKVQIPAEIFLTGLVIRFYALFTQFVDQPVRNIVSITVRINEIILRLGHVESLAFESDDRSDFRFHRSIAILSLKKTNWMK